MVFVLVGVSTILVRLVSGNFVGVGQSLSLVVLVVFTVRSVARVGLNADFGNRDVDTSHVDNSSAVKSSKKLVVWLCFLVTNSNVNFILSGYRLHVQT